MEKLTDTPSAMLVTGIAGSPFSHSRSRVLVEQILARFKDAGCRTELVVVGDIPGDALLSRDGAPELQTALDTIAAAAVVVVGTPVYKATYAGALKTLFDNFPQRFLAGKVAVPVATGGTSNHMLAVDHTLRPLMANEGAVSIARGVYAVDAEFTEGEPSAEVRERLNSAVIEALALAKGLMSLSSETATTATSPSPW